MRELKFRQWTTGWASGKKRMIYLGDMKEEDFSVLQVGKLMQYTGLKDRNGKEIYENDVLKSFADDKETHGEYLYEEVVYRNGIWIAQYIKSEKGFMGYKARMLVDCYNYDSEKIFFEDDNVGWTDVEVIGNVFENNEFATV